MHSHSLCRISQLEKEKMYRLWRDNSNRCNGLVMELVSVREYALTTLWTDVSIYKKIQGLGIVPVAYRKAITKSVALYDKAVLDAHIKHKNTAKLWSSYE